MRRIHTKNIRAYRAYRRQVRYKTRYDILALIKQTEEKFKDFLNKSSILAAEKHKRFVITNPDLTGSLVNFDIKNGKSSE